MSESYRAGKIDGIRLAIEIIHSKGIGDGDSDTTRKLNNEIRKIRGEELDSRISHHVTALENRVADEITKSCAKWETKGESK